MQYLECPTPMSSKCNKNLCQKNLNVKKPNVPTMNLEIKQMVRLKRREEKLDGRREGRATKKRTSEERPSARPKEKHSMTPSLCIFARA